ncbi:MAG: HlyD family efflux transporter periplasmic adaptor subunit [Desulfovibrio sp.]|nr:HlyD family efflux transporter periplasmic adaptor subunit [Desulfovibrio sp.]
MAEPLSLTMPTKKKAFWSGLNSRVVLAGLAVLAILCACGWLLAGRLTSSHAMLDSMVRVLSAPMPGRLAAVDVRAGDSVVMGQAVARMDMENYAPRLEEAGQQATALHPPQMAEMAARIQEAQRAEKLMTERIARMRHDEEALRRAREERVTDHVRAQLALRTLDSQGGEQRTGAERYAAARKAEADARLAMNRAGADFEQASRMRAASERELSRIRDEVQRARDLASQGRYAQTIRQGGGPLPPRAPDGVLHAPISGRVLPGGATAGQTVRTGEPVLLIAPPEAAGQQPYWATAYFSDEAARAIEPGQACRVIFKESGTSLPGTVIQKDASGPLPVMPDGAAAQKGLYTPVRISLDGAVPQGVQPGAVLECTVATHTLFGFSGLF